MGDPLTILIVVVAIGLLVMAIGLRRRRPSDPKAAIEMAVLEAERDRQRTEALESVETAGHQWPGGS